MWSRWSWIWVKILQLSKETECVTFSFLVLEGLRSMSVKSQSISKAKDKIFLVDVETIVSRLLFAPMKLLSWNQVFRNKKDHWNVWIRTSKTQQVWRCYKYYGPLRCVTTACHLANTAGGWKLRGILNFTCARRSKTEQKIFIYNATKTSNGHYLYESWRCMLEDKNFSFLVVVFFLETLMKLDSPGWQCGKR